MWQKFNQCLLLAVICAVLMCGFTPAGAVTLAGSAPDPAGQLFSEDVSGRVGADSFFLSQTATLTGVRVWLHDNTLDSSNNNGTIDNDVMDNFSGTLSWAIYPNDPTNPAAPIPSDTPIITGDDTNPTVTDAGFNLQPVSSGTGFGVDIATVDVTLPAVTLSPGLYFLAIHEGPWLSPADGPISQVVLGHQQSGVGWLATGSGGSGFIDDNETNPGQDWDLTGNFQSFQIFGDVQAANTAVPEPLTGSLALMALATLGATTRRRRLG